MKRGDIMLGEGPGDFAGKPRPLLVVQSDIFNETHASVSVCPITSHLTNADLFRIALAPDDENGLDRESEIEIDKVQTLRRTRLRRRIGTVSARHMTEVDVALRRWLDL